MRNKKAIIFDLGGTLLNLDYPFISDAMRGHDFSVTEDEFYRAVARVNHRLEEVVLSNQPSTDASRWQIFFEWLLEDLHAPFDHGAFILNVLRPRHDAVNLWNYVFPGTAELLAELKLHYRLAMVSNSDGRAELKVIQHGLRDYLEFVIDSHNVGIEKPDKRIFEIACNQLRLHPDECVYVGDIYAIDVIGARAAGIEPILIDRMRFHRQDCAVINMLFDVRFLLAN
ncbi:MAG: HAD family hydrolase [Chlorobiales bacterium]|jgi:HAD superfamily hydrolase (TIGR01509 family)|nr:HAD family hydrolase [Chlorobiales bacterium]